MTRLSRVRPWWLIAVSLTAILASAGCGSGGKPPVGTVRTPTIPAYVREQAGPLADEMSRLTDAYLQVTPVGPAELQPPPKQIPESVLDVDADPMTVRIFQFSSLSRAKAFARTLVPERSGKKAKANLQGTSKRVGPKVYVGTVAEVPTVSVPRFLHIVSLAEGRPVGAK